MVEYTWRELSDCDDAGTGTAKRKHEGDLGPLTIRSQVAFWTRCCGLRRTRWRSTIDGQGRCATTWCVVPSDVCNREAFPSHKLLRKSSEVANISSCCTRYAVQARHMSALRLHRVHSRHPLHQGAHICPFIVCVFFFFFF